MATTYGWAKAKGRGYMMIRTVYGDDRTPLGSRVVLSSEPTGEVFRLERDAMRASSERNAAEGDRLMGACE